MIFLPSSRPRATYWPKFSSPCMVATTITTGLPFSPARYAVIGRPSDEVPMDSLWYQVRGPVASRDRPAEGHPGPRSVPSGRGEAVVALNLLQRVAGQRAEGAAVVLGRAGSRRRSACSGPTGPGRRGPRSSGRRRPPGPYRAAGTPRPARQPGQRAAPGGTVSSSGSPLTPSPGSMAGPGWAVQTRPDGVWRGADAGG